MVKQIQKKQGGSDEAAESSLQIEGAKVPNVSDTIKKLQEVQHQDSEHKYDSCWC